MFEEPALLEELGTRVLPRNGRPGQCPTYGIDLVNAAPGALTFARRKTAGILDVFRDPPNEEVGREGSFWPD